MARILSLGSSADELEPHLVALTTFEQQVWHYADPLEALKVALDHRFHLIVIDHEYVKDSAQTQALFRCLLPKTPILVLTPFGAPRNRKNFGGDYLMSKDDRISDFMSLVESLTNRAANLSSLLAAV
ncbi:MAG TPA: hypothetical protein VEK08_00140 [Planctomycetota bacterium]|nr:hypothetical protein [Planctomycetota bacterium]